MIVHAIFIVYIYKYNLGAKTKYSDPNHVDDDMKTTSWQLHKTVLDTFVFMIGEPL
jgi:hypothetical protein